MIAAALPRPARARPRDRAVGRQRRRRHRGRPAPLDLARRWSAPGATCTPCWPRPVSRSRSPPRLPGVAVAAPRPARRTGRGPARRWARGACWPVSTEGREGWSRPLVARPAGRRRRAPRRLRRRRASLRPRHDRPRPVPAAGLRRRHRWPRWPPAAGIIALLSYLSGFAGVALGLPPTTRAWLMLAWSGPSVVTALAARRLPHHWTGRARMGDRPRRDRGVGQLMLWGIDPGERRGPVRARPAASPASRHGVLNAALGRESVASVPARAGRPGQRRQQHRPLPRLGARRDRRVGGRRAVGPGDRGGTGRRLEPRRPGHRRRLVARSARGAAGGRAAAVRRGRADVRKSGRPARSTLPRVGAMVTYMVMVRRGRGPAAAPDGVLGMASAQA